MDEKIAFVGSGCMAEALINGILKSGNFNSKDIISSDISEDRLDFLSQKYSINTTKNNLEAINFANIVFICVKPQHADDLFKEIENGFEEKLFISIMAGVRTEKIKKYLKKGKIIRVMPNTPALVGKGISALTKGPGVDSDDLEKARLLLQSVGRVIIVEEELMDAVTAISGSGPAYYFWLTEVLAEAAQMLGIEEDQAEILAKETLVGSASLLGSSDEKPLELRKKVTSPGGTTEAAINSLEENNVAKAIFKAIERAKTRSEELSEEK